MGKLSLPWLSRPATSVGVRKNRSRRLPVVVAVAASLVVSGFALANPGMPEARIDLNEGGVWVTNGDRGLIGHLNYPAHTLESGLQVDSERFDISQAARDVVYHDASANSLAPIDLANSALGSVTTPEFEVQAAQGGAQVGVLDPASGNLWVMPAVDVGNVALTADTAMTVSLPDGVIAASKDGVVFGVSSETQELITVTPEGNGYQTDQSQLTTLTPGAEIELTVVGNTPVVIDRSAGAVIVSGKSPVPLPNAGATLQQPGDKSDAVYFSDASTLYRMQLSDGAVTTMTVAGGATGIQAAPVRFGACTYAAWGGSGNYLRWCDDDAHTETMTVDTLTTSTEPVFRTNRDVIVLNDAADGSIWLPDDNMVLVDNWDDIETELRSDINEEDSPQLDDEVADPDRTAENRPPIATDDEFGVRPGSTTLLPVLMNDSDPDGDLLTASITEPIADLAVTQARGGAALQVTIPADASGTRTFVYQAADGRGGTDTATVTLTIRQPSENGAPEQRRIPNVVVASGATVTYNVMPDWIDPDGDLFYLKSVAAPEGVQVQFRQEGILSITDLGSRPGIVDLIIEMSDGEESRTGIVRLDIRANGNIPPVANGDFVVVREGESVTLAPLENDVDPNGDRLTLVSVSAPPPGVSITPSLNTGTFDVVASAKGSYYLSYVVTDGPSSTAGVIRIDVLPRDLDAPPVAQDDLALLPSGGAVLAAVLGNDTDPTGGVLVVQSIELPADAPIQVALVDHHLLRITSPRPLTEPVIFSYTVSNGARTATANVRVVPVAENDTTVPPEPQPDRLKVRAGDVGSVSVLANDRSVNGLALSLRPDLVHEIPASAGLAFVTGNEVRFRAADEPGSYRVTYTVEDAAGNFASSTVHIEVIAADAVTNAAPQPQDLTAWAVAGVSVRIPVTLSGIDPDGDSVALVGVRQPPSLGSVEAGSAWLEYTPSPDAAGTDTFTYLVEDRFGAQAEARVRVGVAAPAALNQPPTAIADDVLVRPDRTVAVEVLANDSDPDGDPLALVPDGIEVSDASGAIVEQRDNRIVVSTPSTADTITVAYRVEDGRGGESTGLLTVHVDPNAPLRAPELRDDIVSQAEVDEQGVAVRVPVLSNDVDPDGDRDLLELFTDEGDVEVEGSNLVIPVLEHRRLVVYGVRDDTGLTGYAVVSVPGSAVERPRLNTAAVPLAIRGGQSLEIDLSRVVVVRPGRTVIITDGSTVSTANGLAAAPVEAGATTLTVTAPADFNGRTSVTFEVADGDIASDSSSLSARITVPVNVTSEMNQPPKVTPSPITVSVAEGPVTVNVCAMVVDPDGTDATALSYRIGRTPQALSATLNGCTLSVSLGSPQPYGALGTIELGVDDGHGEVIGAIPVSVVPSTRPLAQVSEAAITTARPGVTETIDINRHAINPFPDQPLTVIGSPIVVRGEGNVDVQGMQVLVTPSATMLGTMIVNYTLGDATGDAARQVVGTIRLTVRDKPEPPANVAAEVIGPGTVVVRFTAGANNGAPISGFQVVSESGAVTNCSVTECSVTGLPNGQEHRFQVIATNEVGNSEPSGWSAPVLVDVQPNQPSPPVLTARDGAVDVRIIPAVSLGSPVAEYIVTLHPGGQQQTVPASANPVTTFTGLTNGQSYRVSVQAFNRADKPSASSDLSVEAIPFGRPSAPTSAAITAQATSNTNGRVDVTWQLGDGNGRPVTSVIVTLNNGSTQTVGAGVTSASFDVPLGTEVNATVVQVTEGGQSTATTTNTVRPLDRPAAPIAPTVTVSKHDEVTVRGAQAQAGGGYRTNELSLQVLDPATGGWISYSNNMKLGGFTVGEFATVEVRSVAADGTASPTVSATSAEVFYRVPTSAALSVSVTGADAVFTIDDAPAAQGRPIVSYQVRENGKTTTVTDTTLVRTGAPGQAFTLAVKACDDLGVCSPNWVEQSASIAPLYTYTLEECAPAAPDCREVTVTYTDASAAGQQIICTFPGQPTPEASGREGRPIKTSWRTTLTDPLAFEQASGAQISCRP